MDEQRTPLPAEHVVVVADSGAQHADEIAEIVGSAVGGRVRLLTVAELGALEPCAQGTWTVVLVPASAPSSAGLAENLVASLSCGAARFVCIEAGGELGDYPEWMSVVEVALGRRGRVRSPGSVRDWVLEAMEAAVVLDCRAATRPPLSQHGSGETAPGGTHVTSVAEGAGTGGGGDDVGAVDDAAGHTTGLAGPGEAVEGATAATAAASPFAPAGAGSAPVPPVPSATPFGPVVTGGATGGAPAAGEDAGLVPAASMPAAEGAVSYLVASARRAALRSHSPYSRFRVGAAVEGGDGTVWVGTNVESASFGLTMCAERNAIASAIAGGAGHLVRIAVSCIDADAGDGPEGLMPCGACRQLMAEHLNAEAVVDVDGAGSFTVAELLPHSFQL